MKHLCTILLGSLLLSGLQFALTGCIADGYASGSVYYGPDHRDPWFHDGPWIDGGRGYGDRGGRGGGDVYISPPRIPAPPRIHLP